MPCCGFERDGLISMISLSTCKVSPGLVGLGQAISPPNPIMPLADGRPPATRSRMATAAVCQPLAASPLKNARLCCHFVEMERLGVELGGEPFNTRRFHQKAS